MNDETKRAGRGGPIKGSWKRRGLAIDAQVPVNLERILIMAAQNEEFRTLLYDNRNEALSQSGIIFTPSEQAMFSAMPQQMLEATISRLKPARQRNRSFAKTVAAAAVAGGMIIASYACSDPVCGGSGSDIDSDSDTDTDSDTDSDTDTDTDTDSDTDTDTGTSPDAGTDAGNDAGPDAGK